MSTVNFSEVLLRRKVTYYGFELSRESEPLAEFPPELADAARHLLAEAAARGELRHQAVRRNQPMVEEIRDVWRRLGAVTPRLGQAELTQWYASQMGDIVDWETIRALPLRLDRRDFVSDAQLAEARALPGAVEIRDRTVALEYDVEEHDRGTLAVVRLRIPEKLARTMVQEELPTLDRPLRYVVPRGQRGAVRANDLAELQDKLDLPFTEDERHAQRRERTEGDGHRGARPDRDTRRESHRHGKPAGRDGRSPGRGGGGGRGSGGRGPGTRGSGGAGKSR